MVAIINAAAAFFMASSFHADKRAAERMVAMSRTVQSLI
jgi:hypothetical protein